MTLASDQISLCWAGPLHLKGAMIEFATIRRKEIRPARLPFIMVKLPGPLTRRSASPEKR